MPKKGYGPFLMIRSAKKRGRTPFSCVDARAFRIRRERSMRYAKVFIAAVVVCLAARGAAAQSFQGGLRGTVRDAQGVIPGATIVLVNEENGVARETVSNDVGEYSFPGVVPGVYTVHTAVSGFKTFERKGARIGTQQFLTMDI